ncbi:FUSC family protein [Flavobacterium agricola]|uniref:FUSC family protein n=1 Tax=Flavobacterium agricola TaxID=2870839 RepID=A0ABY6M188_9FLAO|nr:FUSC family membrane protein [Flavobacterium agricola]UYW00988.1 FUSC family protein [Flavobacterium agricola]
MFTKYLNVSKEILYKTGNNQFYNAIKITFCALVSFLFFYHNENVAFAFSATLGAMLCAPIDISSNLKHKIIALVSTSVLIPAISILLTSIYDVFWLFFAVFNILVFFSAIIFLYGQRASLMSFTLLLGISLSFIHHSTPSDALANGIHMFYGGMIYLFISIVFYFLMPSRYINMEIANCMDLVAQYLKLRSLLWAENPDVESIKRQQLELQITINESFDKIREYLVFNKVRTINSNSSRKSLIALTSLVEIMELAISITFNNREIKAKFGKNTEILLGFKNLTHDFYETILHLSNTIKLHAKYHSPYSLTNQYKVLEDKIKAFCELQNWEPYSENQIAFNNILFYMDKQIEKIKGLERVYKERVNADELRGKYKDLEKFFTPEHYTFETLVENLNFKSAYFRYAIRMTVAMAAGLLIGRWIDLKNEYWILLTIVVILRPGYGLTKARTKNRVIGTIIGGIIGIIILNFITDTVTLSFITVSAMLLGYWYSSIDYRVGVTFITLYIILVYGILNAGAEISLLFRIIDTLIGALIAFLAANYLWPFWEFKSIKDILEKSISSTIAYIYEVKQLYINKAEVTVAYKIARKDAFVAVGNLMASYQRLVQEPRNKQQNRAELYEIAVLNQTLVAATAGVGTFIQSHKTTEASKAFEIVVNNIVHNLDLSLIHVGANVEHPVGSEADFKANISRLKDIRKEEVDVQPISEQEKIVKIEESQLIIDQLIWMVNLSEQIEKKARDIK